MNHDVIISCAVTGDDTKVTKSPHCAVTPQQIAATAIEAAQAGAVTRSEGGGRSREAQKRAETELPLLLGDVRHGRYTDAVARGNKVLGFGDLTRAQVAQGRTGVRGWEGFSDMGFAAEGVGAFKDDAFVVL